MCSQKDVVVEFLSGLSVLELSELVKEFETKFGVKSNHIIEDLSCNNLKISKKCKVKKGSFERNFLRGVKKN